MSALLTAALVAGAVWVFLDARRRRRAEDLAQRWRVRSIEEERRA